MSASDDGARVRAARSDEIPLIAEAVARQPLMVRYGTSADALRRSLGAGIERGDGLILVEEGARVAGMAWFVPQGTFALGGYLRLIALFPGHEGHGLGALLLDEVERRTAERSRHLFLLCTADNEAALRFYDRRGYRDSGLLPDLVKPGLHEVILWKRLSG
jgi:ribosomal protein S18 acetylase RimI-like enzyme